MGTKVTTNYDDAKVDLGAIRAKSTIACSLTKTGWNPEPDSLEMAVLASRAPDCESEGNRIFCNIFQTSPLQNTLPRKT
jgi:hypothetical protein